jgi:putative transposase
MIFQKSHLYHIYNQGNNRQPIFFTRENYLFFAAKIRTHVLPFADLLAWCLMPNHFHLMVYVNDIRGATLSRAPNNTLNNQTQRRAPNNTPNNQTFQTSFGVMLASYTRAINKQNGWTGSLFRSKTKAICLTTIDSVAPAWYQSQGVTVINIKDPIKEYPNICFNYINFNPVKDGLVKNPDDWEFCSYPDVSGFRNGTLINKERIKEFGLTLH